MSEFIDAIVASLNSGERPRIPLPRVGLTLLPPWGYAIVRKDKRCENRAPTVAGRLKDWRGMVALTHSKAWDNGDYRDAVDYLVESGMFTEQDALEEASCAAGWASHVFAIAELVDVQNNGPAPKDKWAVAGQSGLILGHVLEVERILCVGGRGVFRFGACEHCGKPHAHERNQTIQCRTCKKPTPFESITQPMLTVRSVMDAHGVCLAQLAA